MKTTQLEVKENIDGELYFDLPDDLLNRLGWAEGDDIKFVEQDGGFLIKKVKYETIELDFDKEDLLNYMTYAHNKNITFNELCERAIKEKLNELEKEEG
jgi:bifunctional DNA-binding transcriptional regulator/antitoxin component of YhaV-PrlF toxin-antitoxin module